MWQKNKKHCQVQFTHITTSIELKYNFIMLFLDRFYPFVFSLALTTATYTNKHQVDDKAHKDSNASKKTEGLEKTYHLLIESLISGYCCHLTNAPDTVFSIGKSVHESYLQD